MDNTGFTILDADTKTSLGPINSDLDEIPLVIVFGTLGTYEVDLTMGGTYSGTAYTPTGTYTFYVGPVAELEVRDGGENPVVPAGQRALTIVAVNNGPEDASAAQVTVSGLSAGDYVSHSATAGSFDSSTGIWTIGELRESGYYQDFYGRDGEVLTIITSAAVDAEITAAISNTKDYQVCIDSSGDDVDAASESACTATTGNTWHSTEYYDYVSDNDSATITARGGTGTELLSLGTQPRTGVVVSWNPVTEVNGRTVTHYEVQKRTNPWETVARVSETSYVDTKVAPGDTHEYRIRAVNDRGHPGPWSTPTAAVVEAPGTGTSDGLVEALLEALAGVRRPAAASAAPVPSDADFDWNLTRDIEALAGGHDAATGMWSDGETLWVLQDGSGAGDAVYAYDIATGERLADREFALAEANRAPRGLWSDGATAWVSDSDSDHVYAYHLASGARDEPRDLALARRNGDARGIWSDGDVMYVADAYDAKIYTFNMPDAINARLASLALSGVDIGVFASGVAEYEGRIGEGVTVTTVEAQATQSGATVAVAPGDADAAARGHQVTLPGTSAVAVTVTSAGSTAGAALDGAAGMPAACPAVHHRRRGTGKSAQAKTPLGTLNTDASESHWARAPASGSPPRAA